MAVPGDGVDLEPQPGSPSAAYEERVRLHPRRCAAQAVVVSALAFVLTRAEIRRRRRQDELRAARSGDDRD